MNTLSTHILDTANGHPAAGVELTLERADGDSWQHVGQATTNDDGRVGDLLDGAELSAGSWRLRFDIGAYFTARGQECFYDQVDVAFRVTDGGGHYHVPLLASPWGYSTYRGS